MGSGKNNSLSETDYLASVPNYIDLSLSVYSIKVIRQGCLLSQCLLIIFYHMVKYYGLPLDVNSIRSIKECRTRLHVITTLIYLFYNL